MKLAILAAALLLPASAPAEPQAKEEQAAPTARPVDRISRSMILPASPEPEGMRMPNHLDVGGPDCRSFARQIAEENKRSRGSEFRTLDREPWAHSFLAVDRQVGGCREVTFLRRNAAPGAALPPVKPGPK